MSCRWQAVWKLNDPSKVRIFSLAGIIKYFANNGKMRVKESCTRFNMLHVWPFGGDSDACLLGCDRAQGVWKLTMFKCLFCKIIVMIYGGLGMLDCAYTC